MGRRRTRAQRARKAGYPERFAMENLGHNSKAVHWAYAGLAFAWIAAHIAHHLVHDPAREQVIPLALLALLFASYFTRPESRKLQAQQLLALLAHYQHIESCEEEGVQRLPGRADNRLAFHIK